MEFEINLRLFDFSLSEAIRERTEKVVSELNTSINSYIKKKHYGNDILEYEIIFYLIDMPTGYEHLYRDFKPKYADHKILTSKHTGEKFEINKYFNYSIKIEGELYSKFVNSSDKESKQILASEILKSLSNLDRLPKKVQDFDKERFKSDMKQFFVEQGLVLGDEQAKQQRAITKNRQKPGRKL